MCRGSPEAAAWGHTPLYYMRVRRVRAAQRPIRRPTTAVKLPSCDSRVDPTRASVYTAAPAAPPPHITPCPFSTQPARVGLCVAGSGELVAGSPRPARLNSLAHLHDWAVRNPSHYSTSHHPYKVLRDRTRGVLSTSAAHADPYLNGNSKGSTRSPNNPVWSIPLCGPLGWAGDLTSSGPRSAMFVDRVGSRREPRRPGVIACSHTGPWRWQEGPGGSRFATALSLSTPRRRQWQMRQVPAAAQKPDPDTARLGRTR